MLASSSPCSWCAPQNKLFAAPSAPVPFPFATSPASISFRMRREQASGVGLRLPCCRAAKQQQQREGSVKKRAGGRRSPEKPPSCEPLVEVLPNSKTGNLPVRQNHPSPLPKPPAGFVVDAHGRVLLVSSKRIATVVDSTSKLPLECVIRRVFQSSQGQECMLLCPVDTPVQILKSTNFTGWSAVNDEEIEAIIPSVAYALAKIHMHLVFSGFCYTARGGFCYSEDDILEFRTDDGDDIDGLPAEGIEITCFHQDGTHYMIYTPSDPLLFVAVKDENGVLQIADDDLLDDPAVVGAIDEETEFNALVVWGRKSGTRRSSPSLFCSSSVFPLTAHKLSYTIVEEEAALLESVLGER